MKLLTNQTANTSATATGFFFPHPPDGKKAVLVAEGTFDGCTVGLSIKIEGSSTWVAISDANMTAAGAVIVNGGGFDVRGTVANAGASTSVTLTLTQLA